MRFESIKITNYRQYKNIIFEFPKVTKNDVHIIIASNGVGKTNLLNAINWCLYGDEPHTSGTTNANSRNKLPLCNLEILEEAKRNEEDSCEVSVEIITSEGAKTFTISRSAMINASTHIQMGKDIFEISEKKETGDTIIHTAESAVNIVNRYLPQKIREYFYFDGERLLNYFNVDARSISHIKDSIYEIAQVNVIDDVEKHLGDFEKQYSKKIAKMAPEVEKKQKALDDANEKISNLKFEISKLDDEIEQAEKEIARLNDLINGTETVVADNKKYDKNTEDIKRYEAKLADAKRKLALFVRKYAILILLYKQNKKTDEYIIASVENGSMTLDTSLDVIKESLEEHKCRICGSELNESAEEYLQSLVDKFKSNATIQKLTEIKNDVHRSLNLAGYEDEKKELFDSISEYEERIDDLVAENDELHKRISAVSSIEEIEIAMDRKVDNERTMKSNLEKRGSYKKELEDKEKNLETLKQEYDDALQANEELGDLREHANFVSEAKLIVNKVKNEIVGDVKSRMEQLTMELFETLIWKKETYGRIELDDNFRLKLFHKVSNISCLDSCSASEKELLALAFTIALHTVSGYDNLLFIDTPVGRVSDINRENFAKVLLEISDKKQLILAFTPSEFSDEIANVFNPTVVSSTNYLNSDENMTSLKEV